MDDGADSRRPFDSGRPSSRDPVRVDAAPWWSDPNRRPAPWWANEQSNWPGMGLPPDTPPLGEYGADDGDPEAPAAVTVTGLGASGPAFGIAFVVLAVYMVIAHISDQPRLGRVVIPLIGLLFTIAFARWLKPRHPEEPWLAKFLVLGVLVKIAGTVLRYTTLLKKGQLGDASVYDTFGLRYAKFWLGKPGITLPPASGLTSSNFLRWFTGIVYYLFGRDLITGFFVYSLIAFAGSYLWYRAAVVAVPFLDRRLFFLLMFFAPSVVFWPAGVGKEALVQFGLGSVALGVAYLLTGRLLYGILVALPGAWLTFVVRAHLLGLAFIALAFAYVFGRQRRASTTKSSLAKPIGIVVVVLLAAFGVTQGAKRLHINALTPDAIQTELQATSNSTTQEGSAFNTNVSLSPLRLPQDAVTVLLRPFPWEVQSKNQILASFEGIALAAFMIYRRKSIALSLRMLREAPFLFYAWILTLLYVLLFQAFGNFGLLVRERSIVLPALYVLLSLDVTRARRAETRRAQEWHEPRTSPYAE